MIAIAVIAGGYRAAAQMIPDTVCVGQTKHYWVTPNPVPGSTYTWRINGVAQASTTNEIFVTWDLPYIPAGSPYTISIVERSAAGCFGPERTGLVYLVDSRPVAIMVAVSQNPVCAGTPVTFTALVTNGGTSPAYSWTVNGAPAGTNSQAFTYTPVQGDQVTCQVTSDIPCASNNPATAQPVVMQVASAPVVTFTPCDNPVTSADAQPFRLKGGLPLNGTYSGGVWVNNPSAGMFNPQIAPTGLVPVTYTYTNAAGCSNSATGQIMNHPAQPGFNCGVVPWTDVRDNRNYRTVQIGAQCWLADNLDYGTRVPSTMVQTDNCTAEKYCYNNDDANCASTGALYQWDELMQYDRTAGSQGICPPGWHVPEATEWAELINFLGGNGLAGRTLQDPVTPGFNALPGGVLYQNNTWSFKDLATLFWTSTQAGTEKVVSRGMNNVDQSVSYYESLRTNAFPLRCVKDN
jgi:uncharacterized protein (TIGR02145 family)